MKNIFARWLNPDEPEQRPQVHIEWSNEPPAPIDNPAWQPQRPIDASLCQRDYKYPGGVQVQANGIVYDCWPWPGERGASYGARVADIIALPRPAQRPAALREMAAGRGRDAAPGVIFRADTLPLMADFSGPDAAWERQARVKVQDAFAAMPQAQRARLRQVCAIAPDRLSIQLTIARPSRWDGMKSLRSQLVPVLTGVVVKVLCLPQSLIAETAADPHGAYIFEAGGTPWWSVCIHVDHQWDELGKAA